MASIRSQMVLNDGMSGVLKSINSTLGILVHSFEEMQQASANSVDTRLLQQAQVGLGKTNALISEMEAKYRKAAAQEEQITKNIHETTRAQKELNNVTDDRSNAGGSLKGIIAVSSAIAGAKKVMEISDQMTSTTARLSLIVDDGGSVGELEAKIMASAQRSRANYLAVSDSVAKLGITAGDAFKNTDEIIAFTELLNKNFVVGGASAAEQAAATYQLTQAMASGRLQGDEYRSIIENAPLLASAIEDYMRNVQGAEGSMKEWAAEGLLTAEVIKAAMFESANTVEERFNNMPMTWAQVWTLMKNTALQVFQPILTGINWVANNLSIIGPLLTGIGLGFLVFKVAANWTKIAAIATGIYNGVVNFLSIGFGVLTGNTAAASAATMTYNSALLASPITWIILLIIALIAILYAVVGVINKVTGSTTSATGIITGAVATAVAFIWNLLLGLLDLILGLINFIANPWIAFANFFGNLFNDPVAAIVHLFADMADNVLGILESIARAIDKLFDSNLASAVQGWRTGLSGKADELAAKWGNGSYEKKVDSLDLSSESLGLGRWAYTDAWSSGYSFGENLGNKAGDLFGGASFDDYTELAGNVEETADNTGGMADALEVSNEQLEYLRDIAERDAINRFTTAEVRIDMTGMTNRIDSSVDLDGVLVTLTDGFAEALVTAAEGVHT